MFSLSDSHSVSREAEPVEEKEEYEDTAIVSDPPFFEFPEEGSGFEGSADEDTFMADPAFVSAESEPGSGETWTEKDMGLRKGNFWAKGLDLH